MSQEEKDPELMRLGEIVRVARAKTGDSQDAMGKKLGVAGPTIGTYERAESAMPLKVRERLVDEYGVSPRDVGLIIATVDVDRDVDEFLTDSFNLALSVLSNPEATDDQRQNATKVLQRYRDFKARRPA